MVNPISGFFLIAIIVILTLCVFKYKDTIKADFTAFFEWIKKKLKIDKF